MRPAKTENHGKRPEGEPSGRVLFSFPSVRRIFGMDKTARRDYNLLRTGADAPPEISAYLEDNNMKKTLAILLAVCMLAAVLCGCGEKKPSAASATDLEKEPQQQEVSLPNPVKEYGSLEEINELAHGHLMHPAVMGVTDERFSMIDCGDYQIAQYEYAVNGVPYTYRFSSYVESDISGIYEGGGELFGSGFENEVKEFAGGKAYRFFNVDGQYVLTAKDEGALDLETFRLIAEEQQNLASMFGEDGAAAPYAGDWHEKHAGRGMMSVTAQGDTAYFSVRWANSAFETYFWEFSGEVGEGGAIEYSDGTRVLMRYDEKGNGTEVERIETNSGTISLDDDGSILWTDNDAGSTEPSVFVKD